MAKLTAENLWFSDRAATPSDYKIKDGSTVSAPFPLRLIDQRGSGDMVGIKETAGLETGNTVTFTLLVDQTELDELWAIKGTIIGEGATADWGVVDLSGGSRTDVLVAVWAFDMDVAGNVGDNVEVNVTLRCQGLPVTPNLAHLNTAA